MATDENRSKASGTLKRVVLLTALAGLAGTGGLTLGRVFRGGGSGLRLALAGVMAVLLAGLFERRNILLAAMISAAGLIVVAGRMVFPETTRYLLPTASTFHQAAQALHLLGRTAEAEVAPALPLPPLMLAAVAAVWACGFSSHALAARARSPFLALLPPASLIAFSGPILDNGARPGFVMLFLLFTLVLLFGDGAWRVEQWGTISAWRERRVSDLVNAAGGRGARRVGLACLAVALFTPWILPGFRSPGLVNPKAGHTGVAIAVDPIVSVRPQLQQNPAVTLFTVTATRPSYWRLLSLDAFDGTQWTASNFPSAGESESISGSRSLGTLPDVKFNRIDQQVTFDQLRSPYLPAAYVPLSVNVPEGSIRYDRTDSLLLSPTGTDKGYSYSVTSYQPAPAPEQLDSILSPDPNEALVLRNIALPVGTPPQFQAIAGDITRSEGTMYGKVLAIQDYLRTNFRYTLAPPPPPAGANPLLYFLTRSKAGYCVQFAGAMAVLLRSLGIPARVALGYTQGTPDERHPGRYIVSTTNAHTWVEVQFPGYGWLPFEPTPSRSNPAAATYFTGVSAGAPPGRPANRDGCLQSWREDGCVYPRSQPGTQPTEPGTASVRGGGRLDQPAPTGGSTIVHRPVSWRWRAFEALLALLLLLAVGIPLTKLVARRGALARAADPRQVVLVSYSVLASQAADVGLGRRPHETLWEYRTRLGQRVESLNGGLDALIRLTGRAAYSDSPISAQQADEASETARQTARVLRRAVGPIRRVAGRFVVQPRTVSRGSGASGG
jgi:transglutaminase-like putative cysteine protease